MSELMCAGSERAVLAGITQVGSDAYIDVAPLLDVQSFTIDSNQVIWKCLVRIFDQDIKARPDVPSILSAAAALGYSSLLESRVEREHLKGIFSFPVDPSNVVKFAKKIRKLQLARDGVAVAERIKANLEYITGDESISDIVAQLEGPLFDFTGKLDGQKENQPKLVGKDIEQFIQWVLDNPKTNIGLSTGFPRYDQAIGGGLRRKSVNILCAEAKAGKTTFGDNVAIHLAKQGIPVLNLDTEMSLEERQPRFLANLSDVKITQIEQGRFRTQEQVVKSAGKKLSSLPYYYETVADLTMEEIISIARRWVIREVGVNDQGQTKDCLIIYDYIKMMSLEGLNSSIKEYQVIGTYVSMLNAFAKRHDVPILTFVQMNAESEVSQSQRIKWFCSNLSFFKSKNDDEIAMDGADQGNRKLQPLWVRHGLGMSEGDYINMNFYKEINRITEVSSKYELMRNQQNVGDEL